MAAQPRTSSGDAITRFAGRSANAAARLANWRADPSKVAVVPTVEDHVARTIYQLEASDVVSVCEQTEHALGEVKRTEVERVAEIRDWQPAFAFTHVLHYAVEALGHLPTYGEFRDFCRDDPHGRVMLWDPALDAIQYATGNVGPRLARDAMRWRIGNAYYSFLREAFVLSLLRASGLDAQVHPIADALFRVDLWVAETNVSLFIGNAAYRSGVGGRKDRPEELLADAVPPFRFQAIQLATQHRFGVVHLPDRAAVEAAAKQLTEVDPGS